MTTGGTNSPSQLFGALSHRYRRVVLYYLREHETATFDGLVDLVSGWAESGPGPDESVDRDGVRAELHHVHLPALEAAALVEYDVDDGTVALLDTPPATAEILDAAFEADTTEARLDVEGVLAAAAGRAEPSPGEATCGPEDGDRGGLPGSVEDRDDG